MRGALQAVQLLNAIKKCHRFGERNMTIVLVGFMVALMITSVLIKQIRIRYSLVARAVSVILTILAVISYIAGRVRIIVSVISGTTG